MSSESRTFLNFFLISALGAVTQYWMFIIIPSMVASALTRTLLFLMIIANNMVAVLLLATAADLMSAAFRGLSATAINTIFLGFAGFLNPVRVLYTMSGSNLAVTVQTLLSCFGMPHTWLELMCMAMAVYASPRMNINRRLAIALVILPAAALFEVGYLHLPHA